ncbi:unnamed protein product [Ilex paraguariensis]|uniref:Uncharacterized protein n=1 Tax=Ilex paraguariensis TaxID=185542 RepID=A0ABC8RAU5_9AQUA
MTQEAEGQHDLTLPDAAAAAATGEVEGGVDGDGDDGGGAAAGRVKGPWSPEEDAILSRLVSKFGARNWSLIARGIPGRSGKSCRLRWCNQLDPCVKRKPFSGNTPIHDLVSFSLFQVDSMGEVVSKFINVDVNRFALLVELVGSYCGTDIVYS